jgi:hypothetical protein
MTQKLEFWGFQKFKNLTILPGKKDSQTFFPCVWRAITHADLGRFAK